MTEPTTARRPMASRMRRGVLLAMRAVVVRLPGRRIPSGVAYRVPVPFQGERLDRIIPLRYGPRFEVRDIRDLIQRVIFLNGTWERRESEFVLERLRAGQTFVDVGANVGYYTLIASHAVGPSGRVLAIEPVAENVGHLKANLALNGFTNVDVVPVAATAAEGEARFADRSTTGQTGWGGLDEMGESVVPGRPLDDMLDELGIDRVDMLKIDVEGGEPDVLAGATRLLRSDSFVGPILMEFNADRLSVRGARPDDLLRLIESFGFVDRTPIELKRSELLETRVFEKPQ